MKKSATLESEILDIQAETALNFKIADEILRSPAVDPTQKLGFDERTFLRSRLGWDDSEIARQLNRVRSVARHQSIVGTKSQRDAAIADRERCAKLVETEIPRLQAEIEKLQDQIASIERSATRSTQKVEQIDASLVELQSLLRPDVLDEWESKTKSIAEEFQEIGELNIEISFRENLLGSVPSDFNDRQLFLERVKQAFPDCVMRNPHKLGQSILVEPNWSQRKNVLAKELSEMIDRRSMLVEARSKARAEADELLNFYIN